MDFELLYNKAKEAQELSYSPYSKFAVGCCIQLDNGQFILGANVENASYGASRCAEQTAILKYVTMPPETFQGKQEKPRITTIAIVGPHDQHISPCGICRQILAEFIDHTVKIVLFTSRNNYQVTNIDSLLPDSFQL